MFVRTVSIKGKQFKLTDFDGKKICGKRAGSSYLKAEQPDKKTGNCPGVLIPCSNQTSLENTICYHPG